MLQNTVKSTIPILYTSVQTNFKNHDENKKNESIVFLGRGWVYKGFIDHIDKRFNIINIYNESTQIKSPSEYYTAIPRVYINNRDNVTNIDDIITDIDLENGIIVGGKTNYVFDHDTKIICALGSNVSQYDWNTKINELFKEKPTNVGIIGAGPIGTELAFELSEKQVEVTLYDMIDPYSNLPSAVGNFLKQRLIDKGVNLKLKNAVYIENLNNTHKKTFWATGAAYNSITKTWNQTNNLYANLDGKTFNNVFVAGDCVRTVNSNSINANIPIKTAQNAYDQGMYIAKQINKSNELIEFHPKPKFRTLYIGNGLNIIYHDTVSSFIIIPHFFIDIYHKIKHGDIINFDDIFL